MGQVSFCGAFSMISSLNPAVFVLYIFIFNTSCRELCFPKDVMETLGQIGLIYTFSTNMGSSRCFCA